MSFFSSLMSSLGPDGRPVNQSKPTSQAPKSTSVNPRMADKPTNSSSSITTSQTGGGLKRKADDVTRQTPPKKQGTAGLSKQGADPVARQNINSRPNTPITGQKHERQTFSSLGVPSSSTTKPTPSATKPSTSQPLSTVQKASTASSAISTKPAPKKNSYREVMARAAAAAQQASTIGQIKHKAAPRLSRQERQKLALQQQQERKRSGATNKAGATSSDTKGNKEEYKGTARKSEPIYQGTARPAKPLPYSGTARPGGSSSKQAANGGGRYTYYSSGSEAEDYDEDEDDEGDGSDGMEGGGFDELEAEEEASLRAAREEDMRALQEEQEHRKEKMARKAALEELQRRRAARG